MGDDETPARVIVKEMCYLDCAPATADTPGTGERIVVITLAHKGEVEQPFMLNMRDAKSLALKLLKAMAYYEDDKAYEALEKFWPEQLD